VLLADLDDDASCARALRRVEAGLSELPRVTVDRDVAAKLRRGQSILLRGHDAPFDGFAYAACCGVVVAVGAVEKGELIPGRVFNLPL
jgi:tRNA pseudouridine55 synthase